ncbi:MAG: ABC transporter ATP-binding protein [Dehalococcoides mccartyi]|uniref:ABC transporter ATP-binding protein n=1 Tax=Dehalococcoides mccartyi TaxID=61435 RepID=UPI0004E0AE78|nr:ABC transporter ATP-binding protein [Dehalococcoides mccartyi]AII59491.1 ABC transporter ATP-binding protein [Dehalococcoides mccartyi CG4]
MTDTAISLRDISFSYKRIKALDDLSLEIPCGISFGIMGPNGAGKTTLIRIMVGLLRQKNGYLAILGKEFSRQLEYQLGYMPQIHSLYTELTVSQNIDFFARIYGLRDKTLRKARIEEVIRLVDLWDRRNDAVMNLSGGMKQRVSLACAIVHNPPVIFLDEPTVGLDPELRCRFWEYFKSLNQKGVTIVISSHTLDDAAHCDRLAFLREGRVIAEGTPSELKAATGNADASLEDAFLYSIRTGGALSHE